MAAKIPVQFRTPMDMIGCINTNHMLVPNKKRQSGRIADIKCYLCLVVKSKRRKTTYSCTGCMKGFHVNCFSAFHFQNALQGNSKNLVNIMFKSTKETSG